MFSALIEATVVATSVTVLTTVAQAAGWLA